MTVSYVLSATVLLRLKHNGNARCARCGGRLEVGQKVVRTSLRKRYHRGCYDELFVG